MRRTKKLSSRTLHSFRAAAKVRNPPSWMRSTAGQAKKELKKQDAEIDRKGKIAALFCKAYEKAVLLTPSEENVRCWTDGTRMTPEEMRDTVKESRELAEVFRTIADIIEQKILPADWRCADAESEENDAQPDGNPA